MILSLVEAAMSLVPGAELTQIGANDETSELIWHKPSNPPVTKEQVIEKYRQMVAAEPARIASEKRLAAYRAESDPLFFKAQRGETTIEEWQAKIAEIKSRFPKE